MGSAARALVYGVASVALYALLYVFAEDMVEIARRTREGEKGYFIVPIVIAFVFSMVHGAFTGNFWDALGFRPAQKKKKG